MLVKLAMYMSQIRPWWVVEYWASCLPWVHDTKGIVIKNVRQTGDELSVCVCGGGGNNSKCTAFYSGSSALPSQDIGEGHTYVHLYLL